MKSREEIMNMLEAFDLTGSLRDAGELAGCSHHTVAAYVAKRDEGRLGGAGPVRRKRIIDPWMAKIEEWVERSCGKIRADRCYAKLKALGFEGSDRTVRRAVAEAKKSFGAGRRRVYRPWIPEPGMWAQWGLGRGPDHFWAKDESVLCVAGVVEVPGGDRDLGPHPAHGDRLCGSGDASLWRRCDVLAHRQRAHGHDRSRRWDRCAPSGDGRGRRSLRDHGGDVCAGGPGVQGRVRGDGAGSPRPTWCPPTRTCAATTPAGPSWSRPVRRGWPRSTAASIG